MSAEDETKTIGGSMEETRDRHRRYLRAVNNPLRRQILRRIKDGDSTVEALAQSLDLEPTLVDWHLRLLEDGFCVELKEVAGRMRVALTQEGLVVDYVEE